MFLVQPHRQAPCCAGSFPAPTHAAPLPTALLMLLAQNVFQANLPSVDHRPVWFHGPWRQKDPHFLSCSGAIILRVLDS